MPFYSTRNTSLILSLILGVFVNAQSIPFSVDASSFSTTGNDEFAPVFYNNGIVYCSNALSNTSIKSDGGKLFNMLYIEQRDSGNFKSPDLFSKELTTILNEGPATFSSDGQTIYFSRNNLIEGKFKDINDPSNTMGIYSAKLVDGIWSNVSAFPFNSMEYSLGTPALAPNGERIYFASDKAGGQGGTDIYYADYVSGEWQKPINIGSKINTTGNESYPFMSNSGKLFFASDGLNGLGGKDIYYSVEHNGIWQSPLHLGAEINSSADDYGLVTDINFSKGYFSSNRKHSHDIFSFNSQLPQFGYCDTLHFPSQCFEFYDDRFTDTLHLDYEWNFGGGIKKYGYKIEHCFDRPGNYEVILTIVHRLADSVFETKAMHRFVVESKEDIHIYSDNVGVANLEYKVKALQNNFSDFEINTIHWDFGNDYNKEGADASTQFLEAGEKNISIGLSGEKDTYGRIPRKCYSKKVRIVQDYQEYASEAYQEKNFTKEFVDLLEQASFQLSDKSDWKNYRLSFKILSNTLSMLDVDILEKDLKPFEIQYLSVVDESIEESSLKRLISILKIIKESTNDKLIVTVHTNSKGSAKNNLELSSQLALKIEQVLIENEFTIEQIDCKAYGDNRPILNKKDKRADIINQRIEFIIVSD